MIKLDKTEVYGWEAAIRGTRNPMNSWDKSDSEYADELCQNYCCDYNCPGYICCEEDGMEGCRYPTGHEYIIGPNDHKLMMSLAKSGTDHAKFRRMIMVSVDITAPLYWWKEFDTYKVGTVANSCSTMHKIAEKEFTLDDFSHEHLDIRSIEILNTIIKALNDYREWYVDYDPNEIGIMGCPSKKDLWWQMIQLLPTSYNQKRTVMLNYEVLANIYPSRKNHKLDEWHTFCEWIEKLPYSEIITGGEEDE